MSSHEEGGAGGTDDELGDLKALLQDMIDGGTPVTKSRISAVAECALKNIQKFKKVVYQIERFIKHSDLLYRSAGVCVIDALCTKARKTLGKDKDVFTPRFAIRISDTHAALKNVPKSDKALLDRIFGEWRKRGWFDVPALSEPSSKPEKKSSSSSSSKSHSSSKDKHQRTSSSSSRSHSRKEENGEGNRGGLASPSTADVDAADESGSISSASLQQQQHHQQQKKPAAPVDPRKRAKAADPRKRSRPLTSILEDITAGAAAAAGEGGSRDLPSPPPQSHDNSNRHLLPPPTSLSSSLLSPNQGVALIGGAGAAGGGGKKQAPVDPRKRLKKSDGSSGSSRASRTSTKAEDPRKAAARAAATALLGGGGRGASSIMSQPQQQALPQWPSLPGQAQGGLLGQSQAALLQPFPTQRPSSSSPTASGGHEGSYAAPPSSFPVQQQGGAMRSPERKSRSKPGFFLDGDEEDEEEEDEELNFGEEEDEEDEEEEDEELNFGEEEEEGGGQGITSPTAEEGQSPSPPPLSSLPPLRTLVHHMASPSSASPGASSDRKASEMRLSPDKTTTAQPTIAPNPIPAGWTGPPEDTLKKARDVMEAFHKSFEQGTPMWPDMTGLGDRPPPSLSPPATAVPEWGEDAWCQTPVTLVSGVLGLYLDHRKVKMTQAESRPIVDVTKRVSGRWGVGKVSRG